MSPAQRCLLALARQARIRGPGSQAMLVAVDVAAHRLYGRRLRQATLKALTAASGRAVWP